MYDELQFAASIVSQEGKRLRFHSAGSTYSRNQERAPKCMILTLTVFGLPWS